MATSMLVLNRKICNAKFPFQVTAPATKNRFDRGWAELKKFKIAQHFYSYPAFRFALASRTACKISG